MNVNTLAIVSIASLICLLAAAAFALNSGPPPQTGPAELPADPHSVPVEVVEAHPFRLLTPATHLYRAEQPTFDSGLLLVLGVADTSLLTPRQTLDPVLYVGDETAERINTGHESGNLVVVVPNATLESLAESPVYFGTPEMPERVTKTAAQAELSAALAKGIRPSPNVAKAGREEIVLDDHQHLYVHSSVLIEAYSPSEQDLVRSMRAPRVQTR